MKTTHTTIGCRVACQVYEEFTENAKRLGHDKSGLLNALVAAVNRHMKKSNHLYFPLSFDNGPRDVMSMIHKQN
jgi:hypothetical protein